MDKDGPLTRHRANNLGITVPDAPSLPSRRKSSPKKDANETSTCADTAEIYIPENDDVNNDVHPEDAVDGKDLESEKQSTEKVCVYCPCCNDAKADEGIAELESVIVHKDSSCSLKRKSEDNEMDGNNGKKTKMVTTDPQNEPEPLAMSELFSVCVVM